MPASLDLLDQHEQTRLCIGGQWTLPHYRALATRIDALRDRLDANVTLDFAALTALDTAGAQLLCELIGHERLQSLLAADALFLHPHQRALLQAVAAVTVAPIPLSRQGGAYAFGDVLAHIGRATITFWNHVVALVSFIGLTLEGLALTLFRPRHWRISPIVANLERTGFDAVPIVALLTFLVGAVVAFLGATVLANFGATIYTVNLIAYAFLREFGVLLAAILVAGRTASAFAAQIGSMRANEEIDALRVLGLDPVAMLILPRVFALLIALPILTFIAIVCGIAGGMTVCAVSLDIPPEMFLSVISNNIKPRHFFIGMGKAPVFAFLIAVIGCLEGFRVSGSAQSVGEHTTSAVVQSIFTVIVVDAVAALFCMEMEW
ncbi:MAG: ABC transporter permease [Azoarcus sp.]|jgi:phospholipid/cholesterol/gamma-HCH transport system permease protein|nr:ABC transporter permease [Azoarcus sp.]